MSIFRVPVSRYKQFTNIPKILGTRRFTEKTVRAVSDFIDFKHDKTLFKYEVYNITQAVTRMIENIIIQSSEKDHRFKIRSLQLIGSMYEGTKVSVPNEFDFFAVFDYDVIGDRKFGLESGCRPGFTKIRVKEISKDWLDCCQGLYLSPHICMRKFESLLPSQIADIEPIATPSGTLHGWKRRKRTFDLYWKNADGSKIDIAVDIMPAFPVIYRDLPKTLREDCTDTRMHEIGPNQACFLIPRSCEHYYEGKCWHNSFAHAESELIRKMDAGKKKCHRVLKLLFTDDLMGKSGFLTSYALKSAIMYKSKKEFINELDFLLYIFIHFAKCFDQTCMPTYFLTKTNVWKNIIEHRTQNIWDTKFLYDYHVKRQIKEHIDKDELKEPSCFPAWNVAVILEFWRRMMILFIVLFCRAESSMALDFSFSLINDVHSKSNQFYMEKLKDWKINWLVAAPQYDVLTLRANHRKVIRALDIPVYTELIDELQKYKLLDMRALNSLVLNNQYAFEAGNNTFIDLDVRRHSNVYIPHTSSCKSEALLLRQLYTNR